MSKFNKSCDNFFRIDTIEGNGDSMVVNL